MPYKVFKIGPGKNPYCVYKLDREGKREGDAFGCHPSSALAASQARAVYAAEAREKEADKKKATDMRDIYECLNLSVPKRFEENNEPS